MIRGCIMKGDRCLLMLLGVVGAIASFPFPVGAQLQPIADTAPDRSLGTTVEPLNVQTDLIRNGVRSANGVNLFHSFQEFNIGQGRGAYFIVPDTNVVNILARVTGGNPSQILGTLGSRQQLPDGTFAGTAANLFLMNPNGIVFGENARLDLGGSFTATTANGVEFGDRGSFDATNPTNAVSVLTVNPSAYLFSQVLIGGIVNRSVASSGAGLQVLNGQSLILLGGNVALEGGILQALGGRVELGGLAASGRVGLVTTGSELRLQFPEGVERSDVSLSNSLLNGSSIYVVANGGGSISINARNLNILGGSYLWAGIKTELEMLKSQAGDITLDVVDKLQIAQSSYVINTVSFNSVGNSGNLTIKASSLTVTDRSGVFSGINGRGRGGNLLIQVRDQIVLDNSSISSYIGYSGSGNSSDIAISTGSLELRDDAKISAEIYGQGDSGNVSINVLNNTNLHNSGISNISFYESIGSSGYITLNSGSISLKNAAIYSIVAGAGNGGNIAIYSANNLEINIDETLDTSKSFTSGIISDVTAVFNQNFNKNGGSIRISVGGILKLGKDSTIRSSIESNGDGGDILINANAGIIITGTTTRTRVSDNIDPGEIISFTATQGNGGNISVRTSALQITDGARLVAGTINEGKGGNIAIDIKDNLELLNGGVIDITSKSNGTPGKIFINADNILISGRDLSGKPSKLSIQFTPLNNAGEININALNLKLDNQGQLVTFAPSGNGGNLTLDIRDLLLLRHNSKISVTAGSETPNGNGGNININSRFIVAIPKEDSDITANATQGRGGNVNINSQGIFGLKLQPKLTPSSDITASSEVGLSGKISLNTPDNSGIQNSLSQLPTNSIDTCLTDKNIKG
jgi:filamentous hemagglutinin family protein